MCRHCNYSTVLLQIEDLLGSEDSVFAEDTLNGIYEWVEDNEHVTEKQRIAVENIAAAAERRRG